MDIFSYQNFYKLLFFMFIILKINSKEVELTIQGKVYTISSENVIDEDTELKSGEYISTSLEEPVIIVRGESLLQIKNENILIKKVVDTSNSQLDAEKQKLGLYSAIIALGSSTIEIETAAIETNCNGCIGITVLENAKVNFYDGNILTHEDNSPAIYLNFGGELLSDSITLSTDKNYSPCISLLGQSKITISNSHFNTKGTNSELFYSEGNAFIASSDGKAEKSNIVISKVIDDSSQFVLSDCEIEGLEGVKIYSEQSITSSGQFNVLETKLTLNNENSDIPMFEIIDSTMDFTFDTSEFNIKNEFLMNAKGSDELKNGAQVTVNVEGLTVNGRVKADSQSNVHFNLQSQLSSSGIKGEGNVNIDNN